MVQRPASMTSGFAPGVALLALLLPSWSLAASSPSQGAASGACAGGAAGSRLRRGCPDQQRCRDWRMQPVPQGRRQETALTDFVPTDHARGVAGDGTTDGGAQQGATRTGRRASGRQIPLGQSRSRAGRGEARRVRSRTAAHRLQVRGARRHGTSLLAVATPWDA